MHEAIDLEADDDARVFPLQRDLVPPSDLLLLIHP